MTKGELRKARKQAVASGRPWNIELSGSGRLEQVSERTPKQEQRHQNAMYRWASRYADTDGSGTCGE